MALTERNLAVHDHSLSSPKGQLLPALMTKRSSLVHWAVRHGDVPTMPKRKRATEAIGDTPPIQMVDPTYAARCLEKMERLARKARDQKREGSRDKISGEPPEAPGAYRRPRGSHAREK